MIDINLKKVKEIFLSKDLDSEDYEENLQQINSWEKALHENEDFQSWQESDITRSIIEQTRKSYKETAMLLINSRTLTEEQRKLIYAKQDAMIWLLSLVYKDVKSSIEIIHKEIERTLKVAS